MVTDQTVSVGLRISANRLRLLTTVQALAVNGPRSQVAVGQSVNGPAQTVNVLGLAIVLAPIGTVVLIVARLTIVGGAMMTVTVLIAGS